MWKEKCPPNLMYIDIHYLQMVYRYHLYTGTVYQYTDLDGFWGLDLGFFF